MHPDTPENGYRLPESVRARMAGAHQRLEQMAQAAGLPMVFTDLIPNSRRALEATEYAREQGRANEFHHAVFDRIYGQGLDIHDWSVLREAATQAGLDPEEMQREVESGRFHELLDAEIEAAQQLGVTAVPTYVVNDRYGIVGAQPYEVFERVLKRIKVEMRDNEG